MKQLMGEGYDAIFVGSGAPRGRDLQIPGRKEGAANIHIGIDWLSSVSFGHTSKIGKRVIVLGGGNTAMDCCRTSRRLGGDDVKVIVRSGFEEMKASPWEKEDAQHEGIPILNYLVPKEFTLRNGKLSGMIFEKVKAQYDAKGRRNLVATGEPDQFFECDDVLVAVGQENAFPWIEKDCGVAFDEHGMPVLDKVTFQSSAKNVFFGGDSAFGPKNIIWAVAHGHDAAISIDKLLQDEDLQQRPAPDMNLMSQKMGIHEWSYDSEIVGDQRFKVPWADVKLTLKNVKMEVELGFDAATAWKEAQRCLNCDVQTVFHRAGVHRVRRVRRHLPDGLHHVHRGRRRSRPAHAPQRAGEERHAGPLHRRAAEDRPDHGEGRGRLPALRPVRRALPDRRVGHAEDADRHGPRRDRTPARSTTTTATRRSRGKRHETHRGGQRFRHQVRQRERLGVGFGQRALRQGVPADGDPGQPAQHLPVEHPGAADVVRGARHREGPSRPARRRRPDGRDEPADLEPGHEGDRAGRVRVLRQHQAAAEIEVPRRRERHRHAAHRHQQLDLQRLARAAALQEHHLRRRARLRCSTWTRA
jgi:hypothetical protein